MSSTNTQNLLAAGVVFLLSVYCVESRVGAQQPGEGLVDIGSRRELFVDQHLIADMSGAAALRLQQPVAREVAVVHDAPWEGNTCAYHTVFQDGGIYRMYYRGSHYPKTADQMKQDHPQLTCYAESHDGIVWTKPQLGLYDFNGSKDNNIVWMGEGCHNFAPFKDSNPHCSPEAAYKALGHGEGGLLAFGSPDGLHWKQLQDAPVITKGAFDSQNLAFWDPARNCYVDYHRDFTNGVRAIMTCTSQDFRTWSDPVWVEYPAGTPDEHLYTNQIVAYHRAPHIKMGFPKRFQPDRQPEGNEMPGLSDGVFMTSRDGELFHRFLEAFVRPGPQRERWVNRNNMTAWGVVETDSAMPGCPRELSIYSTEGYYHGDSCAIRRYSVRLDGFVSLNAPMAGGGIVTRPLTFAADRAVQAAEQPCQLLLNYATSAAGSVRVELQHADGSPIDGFALDDCPLIYGDHIERAVVWKGGNDLRSLAGRPICIRFELRDADLYALRFGTPDANQSE